MEQQESSPASVQEALASCSVGTQAPHAQQNQEKTDQKLESQSAEGKKFEFMDRVANIPIFSSACNIFTGVYGQVKESNEYIKKGLETGEAAFKYAAEQAGTAATVLETPLHTLDSAACKGLNLMEKNVPIITKPAGELIDTSKGYLDSARSYTAEKVGDMQTFTTEKVSEVKTVFSTTADAVLANPYTQQVFGGLNVAMDKVEEALQGFFPVSLTEEDDVPSRGTNKQTVVTAQPKGRSPDQVTLSLEKVRGLSAKVRGRIHMLALEQLQQLQQQSRHCIHYMSGALDWMQLSKGNIDSATLKSKAQLLLAEINKNDETVEASTAVTPGRQESAGPSNMERQVISAARFVSGQLMKAYKIAHVALQLLPEQMQQVATQAIHYSSDMYAHFSQASSMKDISDATLAQWHRNTQYLQATVASLYDTAIKDKALTWLIFDTKEPAEEAPAEDSKSNLEELVHEAGATVPPDEAHLKTEQSAK